MNQINAYFIFFLLACTMLISSHGISAENPSVTILNISNAPVELSFIKENPATLDYQIIVHNKSDKTIAALYLISFLYSPDNIRKGGASHLVAMELLPKKDQQITINFKGTTPDHPSAPDMVNDLFDNTGTIILIPARVDFKLVREKDTMSNTSWMITIENLIGISPINSTAYAKIQGTFSRPSAVVNPKFLCAFAEWINAFRQICGTSLVKNKCSKSACTHSFYSECPLNYAAFMCKSTDQCCER